MTLIVRTRGDGAPAWAARRTVDGRPQDSALPALSGLLAMPLDEARAVVEAAQDGAPAADGPLLPPVDRQEVWAAGVTYLRSRDGRMEESGNASIYDLVYDADRPEVFFKATPERVVGDGDAVGIRADSGWDVPEPELGLVLNAAGEIFGYTAGNDMSSRSIEGENALYLPQAKVYTRSCALGPAILPVWEADRETFGLAVTIRRDGGVAFAATGSTADMKRSPAELADWLTRALEFPVGVVLLTGTALVPDRDFTLREGDTVEVEVEGVGRLTNRVVVVGR